MTAPSPDDSRPSASRGALAALFVIVLAVAGGGWWWTHRTVPAADGTTADAPAAGRPDANQPAAATGTPATGAAAGKPDGAAKGDAGARKGGRGGAPSVVVAPVRVGDLEVWSDSLGTVTPLANVTIHSRVDGQLLRVLYHEGQHVHRGDLLAEIDPRPFQVVLDQALAQQARDRALLDNARVDLARYQDLANHDAVPRQTLDTQASLVAQNEATLRNDQATIDSARLNLSFCRIQTPVSGQAGLRQIDPGNMVHAADATGLVTVAQMDPISVLFSLPQDQLPQIQKRLRERKPVRLEAMDRAGTTRLAQGTLTSLDNQIDTTTGAIKLRGSFSNRDGTLYPNQFVNLRVLLETRHQVVVAPTAALLRGAQGPYVYQLNDDRTVSVRPVTVGPASRTEVLIEQGLSGNEKLVVDGTDKLREGMAVQVAENRGGAGKGAGAPAAAAPAQGSGHRHGAKSGQERN